MVAAPDTRTQLVPCPTCKGTGEQVILLKSRRLQRPCLACWCTGKVESARVCATCGKWRNTCGCHIRRNSTRRFEREHPKVVIEVEPTPPIFSICPFNLAGCELHDLGDGFDFCPRCAWAELSRR
jgi:hypothetical protein